jgi:hypothetical protein
LGRIDNSKPIRFKTGQFEVTGSHFFMECHRFGFKATFMPGALAGI